MTDVVPKADGAEASKAASDLGDVAAVPLAVAGAVCAVLYLATMTYTLAAGRDFDPMGSFFLSALLTLLALLTSVAYLITDQAESPARIAQWATAGFLAALLLAAATVGESNFGLSTVLGFGAVVAIPAITEVVKVMNPDL